MLTPDSTIYYLIYQQKAQIYSFGEKHKEALENYEKSYRYNPKDITILYNSAYEISELGDKERALKYYQKFIAALNEKYGEQEVSKASNTISLKKIAEQNIQRLKEELFFEGKF